MSGKFNENIRIHVPAAIHLCRLGYTCRDYIDETDYDPSTNILVKLGQKIADKLNRSSFLEPQ